MGVVGRAVLLWALPMALAIPQPPYLIPASPSHATTVARHPTVTEAPDLDKRAPDFFDDVGNYVNGIFSDFGSGVSSYIASGVPQFFQDLPVGDSVIDQLGISDEQLDARPIEVLNLPPYGYWDNDSWNVRARGNVYKQPEIAGDRLDDLANVFLVDTDIADLPPSQQAQARNMTASIFVVQQDDQTVAMDFVLDSETDPEKDGGALPAAGGAQTITLPDQTTQLGDFDVVVRLENTTGPDGGFMVSGDDVQQVQTLKMFANGTDTGNATVYLVPPLGVTIVSDVDDILRVTKIYDPKEGLLNSFARPFTPWENMPEIYASWAESTTNLHFHYLTTTPEQVTRNYMEFIYANYPLGSFDTRPLNFSDVSATLSIRAFLLDKIIRAFPRRQFILVADTTNSDVMKSYPSLYKDFPGQIACILLRNTSATDSTDKFPYNTGGFEGIPQENYMFFRLPDDLRGIDVSRGQCYNPSVPQNVTFDWQNVPFMEDAGSSSRPPGALSFVLLGSFVISVCMFWI